MSQMSLRFKVKSLKASFLATLKFKLCTAFYLRDAHGCANTAGARAAQLAFICGLFFSLISQPSFADTTQPAIRDLDRMFTTRYERAQLDALRDRMTGNTSGVEMPATENSIRTSPLNVEMQGIMQREKGRNVAWINGQSTLNNNVIDDNVRVGSQPQALRGASVTISGQTVRLKPGQVWQQESGKVVESYRTKVAAPVTKGADENKADVQTGESDTNQAATQPPVKQP
ncbi:MAG: hypothetical protein QG652_55 [Pseudomonadota bacterium]|nr:hypothetical protein [Pseudomonadota bacterium]